MMKTKCILKYTSVAGVDALVVPYYRKNTKRIEPAFDNPALHQVVHEPIKINDFKGKLGELAAVYPKNKREKRILLLGLGELKNLSTENLRRAYAKLVSYCHEKSIQKIRLIFPKLNILDEDDVIQGVCEGLFLSNYVFEHLKGLKEENTRLITHCVFIGLSPKKSPQLQKWQYLSEGVCLARDLINDNADTINAQTLGEEAKKLSVQFKKIQTTVLDKKRLEEENLRFLLTVNRGSQVDPALIVIKYEGAPKSKQPTVVVGKGVTYDSGGIQLKPRTGNIIHMKCDMSGAAAVLGILYAAAKLDLPLNIVGLIPACENAIGPKSYKPGDVYKSYLGKTVEIISTDAEGRLILADALAYAQDKFNPSQMIDLATLTGGVVAALGDRFTGLMSNDKNLSEQLRLASKLSGEKLWELPLEADYKEALRSNIADLRNSTTVPGYPSAIVAGLFLQEFVKSTPWAHLDIAGTAYLSHPRDYHKTKATGVGVRLVIAFLEELLGS